MIDVRHNVEDIKALYDLVKARRSISTKGPTLRQKSRPDKFGFLGEARFPKTAVQIIQAYVQSSQSIKK